MTRVPTTENTKRIDFCVCDTIREFEADFYFKENATKEEIETEFKKWLNLLLDGVFGYNDKEHFHFLQVELK